jgi:5-methylcytosine-specific restriction protein A
LPQRLKKPCHYPGCPVLVEAGQTYCKKHRDIVNREKNKRYNKQKRDKEMQKFYNSSSWKKLRKIKLNKDPLCERCLKMDRIRVADVVHHIKEAKEHPELRLREDNLMSLCHNCHNKLHKAQQG